jgi:hypothetical protein
MTTITMTVRSLEAILPRDILRLGGQRRTKQIVASTIINATGCTPTNNDLDQRDPKDVQVTAKLLTAFLEKSNGIFEETSLLQLEEQKNRRVEIFSGFRELYIKRLATITVLEEIPVDKWRVYFGILKGLDQILEAWEAIIVDGQRS